MKFIKTSLCITVAKHFKFIHQDYWSSSFHLFNKQHCFCNCTLISLAHKANMFQYWAPTSDKLWTSLYLCACSDCGASQCKKKTLDVCMTLKLHCESFLGHPTIKICHHSKHSSVPVQQCNVVIHHKPFCESNWNQVHWYNREHFFYKLHELRTEAQLSILF